MAKLDNAFMSVLWYRFLDRFNATSKFLQKVEIDLKSANKSLISLVAFVNVLRNKFADIEFEAKKVSSHVE